MQHQIKEVIELLSFMKIKAISIVEEYETYKSNHAIPRFYLYDNSIIEIA